jgi:hypothetical protein
MFRITWDPSSGSDNLYLIEITYNGSVVLIMCVVGVWRHVLDCNREGKLLGVSPVWWKAKWESKMQSKFGLTRRCVCALCCQHSAHTPQVQNMPPKLCDPKHVGVFFNVSFRLL